MPIRVAVVGTADLQRALSGVPGSVASVIDKALLAGAFELEGHVKNAIEAVDAIDTGFMLNSVYSANVNGSNYSEAAGRAAAKNPTGEMLNEVQAHEHEAVVAVGAGYARHVEFGTENMEARSFMRSAMDEHSADVIDAVRVTMQRLIGEVAW